jgi:hypothetical protein
MEFRPHANWIRYGNALRYKIDNGLNFRNPEAAKRMADRSVSRVPQHSQRMPTTADSDLPLR